MINQIKLISIICVEIILSLQVKVKSHEIKLPTHNYYCPKFGNVSITEANPGKTQGTGEATWNILQFLLEMNYLYLMR